MIWVQGSPAPPERTAFPGDSGSFPWEKVYCVSLVQHHSSTDLREAAKRVDNYVNDRISQTLVKVGDEVLRDESAPKAVLP